MNNGKTWSTNLQHPIVKVYLMQHLCCCIQAAAITVSKFTQQHTAVILSATVSHQALPMQQHFYSSIPFNLRHLRCVASAPCGQPLNRPTTRPRSFLHTLQNPTFPKTLHFHIEIIQIYKALWGYPSWILNNIQDLINIVNAKINNNFELYLILLHFGAVCAILYNTFLNI